MIEVPRLIIQTHRDQSEWADTFDIENGIFVP